MCFAEERESGRAFSTTHANGITAPDLSGRDQIREWLNEQALDGALQMTSSVSEIRTVCQQVLSGAVRNRNGERFARRVDAFLNHSELDVNYPVQFIAPERFEDHDLVQTVHKLRREGFSRGRDAYAPHASVEFFFDRIIGGLTGMESQFRSADGRNVAGTEVTGHEHHR